MADKKTKQTPVENEVTGEFSKRRKSNLRLLMLLALFAFALWGMTFFFRLNYIKGIAE